MNDEKERMKHMIESKCEVPGFEDEFQASVSVPVERYEKLILAERWMETVAEMIADEWAYAAVKGYGDLPESLKAAVRMYCPALYKATVRKIDALKNMPDQKEPIPPVPCAPIPTDKGPNDYPPAPTVAEIDWTKRGTVTNVQTDLF
jgi:hypothetical protein